MTKRQQTENTAGENLELIAYKIDSVEKKVDNITVKLESDYATKEWCDAQYGQTKKYVNALIATFATAIVLAFAGFILRGGLK